MWGISPTLGCYTRVKTHVCANVFDSRVTSLTRPRIDLFMGKYDVEETIYIGLSFKRFG